ncbi:MAG: DoxX family protein [Candidatus Korobacteraceae bacterium]|jgi:putative oxidoreductase
MLQRLLRTTDDLTLTLMRLVLAFCIFPHGAQKLLGWFGGHGLGPAIEIFAKVYHIPPALTVIAVCIEFFGSIALVLGLLGRLSALGVAITMTVAAYQTYLHFGNFFMNWFGMQKGEGIEYHLLAIVIALAIAIRGSGAFSLDRLLSAKAVVEPGLQYKTKAQNA